jgi:hypothetical protein
MSNHGSGDNHSTFSNDEGPPFTFNLTQLEALVSQHIDKSFQLRKLAEGGYHKVLRVKHRSAVAHIII